MGADAEDVAAAPADSGGVTGDIGLGRDHGVERFTAVDGNLNGEAILTGRVVMPREADGGGRGRCRDETARGGRARGGGGGIAVGRVAARAGGANAVGVVGRFVGRVIGI